MAEEKIFFRSGSLKIEALLSDLSDEKAVVVTHPHPLYGGDMRNHVVESVVRAYQERGFSTLRFNFRGVGQSQGQYDNGIGEQEDVGSALAYMMKLDKKNLDLVGYSFGAWVNALGLERYTQTGRVVMISPPVNFIDFSFLGYSQKIQLVIAGSRDEIAPPEMIQKMLPTWNPLANFRVIKEADHFYSGESATLMDIIKAYI